MTSIELRVRSIYDSLSNAEKKVADYFLNNVEVIFHKPIAQNSIRAIQDTAEMLDPNSLEQAAKAILNAESVRIFGVVHPVW